MNTKYDKHTIRKLTRGINEGYFYLPHIQRSFVWKEDQIKNFFDSILREYPIGMCLFWITKDSIQMRKFIDIYYKNMDVSRLYVPPTTEKKSLVLDGQQRLQALYIALFGTYDDRELYIDILSGDRVNEEGIKYVFDFFKRNDMKKGDSFILLKDIVFNDEKSTELTRKIVERLGQKIPLSKYQEGLIQDNVAQIKKLFAESELVNYYNIDSTEGGTTAYDEILEIFVRVNSGGTVLSKSDLMFSLMKLGWPEAEEKFEELLREVNKNGMFSFNKDFVLKTALTLIGSGAKYEVEKFRGEKGERNLKEIESKWAQIENSIRWTIDFINDYAYIRGDKALRSYNVLIPVIYYSFIKNHILFFYKEYVCLDILCAFEQEFQWAIRQLHRCVH